MQLGLVWQGVVEGRIEFIKKKREIEKRKQYNLIRGRGLIGEQKQNKSKDRVFVVHIR